MGRRRPSFKQHQPQEYDSLLNNEVVKHDLERLRKILGPCKDIEELEDALIWPQKAQAELDAEWLLLCNEYSKLTGGTQPMDGVEVPSMSDMCYYIGDWAVKYVDMGNTIPTTSGKTPMLAPYWAKNQVLLFADNGRVCPPEFKQEMDEEVFSLLHSTNINIDNPDQYESELSMQKLELVMTHFFFAGKNLAQMFDYVCEEYEKRLRRGLMQVQTTPFSDLLYKIGSPSQGTPQSERIELVKSFVTECEALKGRHFTWGLKNSTFDIRLPSCTPPPSSSDLLSSSIPLNVNTTVIPLRKWHKLKGMAGVLAAAFSLILCLTFLFNIYL